MNWNDPEYNVLDGKKYPSIESLIEVMQHNQEAIAMRGDFVLNRFGYEKAWEVYVASWNTDRGNGIRHFELPPMHDKYVGRVNWLEHFGSGRNKAHIPYLSR